MVHFIFVFCYAFVVKQYVKHWISFMSTAFKNDYLVQNRPDVFEQKLEHNQLIRRFAFQKRGFSLRNTKNLNKKIHNLKNKN